MSGFMNYAYVFLWLIMAVMVVAVGRKEGAFAYALAAFFLFMTVWYGLRAFAGIAMFEGVLGVVFRVIIIVYMLILLAAVYIRRRRK